MLNNIIKFQEYINAKEEEKKRIKQVSVLFAKSKNIEGILHSISNSVGCSFVTKHFNELNQIVGKENIIDDELLNVIINSLNDYNININERIKGLIGDRNINENRYQI